MDEKIVNEIMKELAEVCDLDDSIQSTLKPVIQKVIKKYMTDIVPVATSAEAPVKTKKGSKKATVKSDKIPHKNGYHFFVGAKMNEVKDAGVPSKERMTHIGSMWGGLDENGRKPYQEMARLFNESVDGEMKTEGWAARRDTIVSNANVVAGVPKKNPPPKKESHKKESKKDTPKGDEVVIETTPLPATVVTVAPVDVPTVAPVAASTANAPVVKTAPVRRKKTT